MTSLEGQQFHDYEVLTLLGRGSVGAVYKARQVTLDRLVSLKVLLPGLSQDREFIARFKQEAIAAARLNHPNLVQVYSAGECDGLFYLSMEFIEGDSLQQRLEHSGRLDIQQSLATCYYVAHALDEAWQRGTLIHRAIQPSNIYLSRHGEVKLGDLGVAKPAGAAFIGDGGKPYYISPEQVRGESNIDLRSDIYSLGCVLYHMLAGQPPYDGRTARAVMQKHADDPTPTITKTWPECPAQVALLLSKMMAKDPAARYQDYAELIADLVRVSEQLGLAPAGSAQLVAPKTPRAVKPATARTAASASRGPSSSIFMVASVVIIAAVVVMVWAPWKERGTSGAKRETSKAAQSQRVDREDAKAQSEAAKGQPALPKQATPLTSAPEPSVARHGSSVASASDAWAASIASLAPEERIQRVVVRLKELNPGYDGQEKHKIADGRVTELTLSSGVIKDLSPVRALTGLQKLVCSGTRTKGALSDLSPLHGMTLTSLRCPNCQVTDLSPLRGMPLEHLSLVGNPLSDLQSLVGKPLTQLFLAGTQVNDLSPLKGMPLSDLYLEGTRVVDLSPLRGMPLSRLSLTQTLVADLTPIQDAPLTFLNISGTAVKDLSPVAKMPLRYLICDMAAAGNKQTVQMLMAMTTLQKVNGKSVNDFIQAVNAAAAMAPQPDQTAQAAPPAQPSDPFVTAVAAMPAEQQVDAVIAKLREINPRFDTREQHRVTSGTVTDLTVSTAAMTDISPVRALVKLQRLSLAPWAGQARGALTDLTPLKGLPLAGLWCHNTQVADLAPLRDMPLTVLTCDGTAVRDLAPLRGMKLTVFGCSNTAVDDLAPLEGMPLTVLWCNNTKVTDLSPLKGMPLKELRCDFDKDRDALILDGIATLEKINDIPAASFWTKVGPIVLKSGGRR
ncbi:MAG: protein kinase [Verrucomicrobia bacterium]|nr:protein kinase [Verrucomicrobiota bacterium]